ncbi:MAG: alpha-ketoglutarate-dependent dioxygenase AlkB [Gilvibacter sp.]
MDLFSTRSEVTQLNLKDAQVSYYPNFLSLVEAHNLYTELLQKTPWQQDDIKVFGKVYKQPRLTALYGSNTKPYSYSGITMHPMPFTPALLSVKKKAEALAGVCFTTALLNHYRDGQDSNGWHSDDEPELGQNPVIASVSLGAKRPFKLRPKANKAATQKIWLEHGSLLLMAGSTQHYWQHQLPKSTVIKEPRINITFRVID